MAFRLQPLLRRCFSPRIQVVMAWVLFVVSVIGWPASALTLARGEPQFILGLSWLAIIVGALNTIITANVNQTVTPDEEGERCQ